MILESHMCGRDLVLGDVKGCPFFLTKIPFYDEKLFQIKKGGLSTARNLRTNQLCLSILTLCKHGGILDSLTCSNVPAAEKKAQFLVGAPEIRDTWSPLFVFLRPLADGVIK